MPKALELSLYLTTHASQRATSSSSSSSAACSRCLSRCPRPRRLRLRPRPRPRVVRNRVVHQHRQGLAHRCRVRRRRHGRRSSGAPPPAIPAPPPPSPGGCCGGRRRQTRTRPFFVTSTAPATVAAPAPDPPPLLLRREGEAAIGDEASSATKVGVRHVAGQRLCFGSKSLRMSPLRGTACPPRPAGQPSQSTACHRLPFSRCGGSWRSPSVAVDLAILTAEGRISFLLTKLYY